MSKEYSDSDSNSNEKSKTPLINIDIQLTDDETANLTIYEDDVIDQKVQEFCKENNLGPSVKELITNQVMEQLQNQINQLEQETNGENSDENSEESFEDGSNYESYDNDKFSNQQKYNDFSSFKNKIIHRTETYNSNRVNSKNSTINRRKKRNSNASEMTGGERMYKQYKEQLPKKEAIRKRIAKEKLDEESKELSFRPKISKRSQQLAQKSNERIEDRLIESGLMQKRRNVLERGYRDALEKEKSPNRPTLPAKSRIIGDIKRKVRLDEIPPQVPGINMDYIELSRNKSSDILLSKEDLANHIDSQEEYHLNPRENNSALKNYSLLDEISSKYSFSNLKSSGTRRSTTPNNLLRSSAALSKKRSETSEKRSMIFHRKIPKPQLRPEKNIHDYLYLEAKLIDVRRQRETSKKMKEICPFRPTISETAKNIYKNKRETTNEFIKRMASSKKENEEICISQTEPNKSSFRPTITRGPKDSHRREIYDDLNNYYDSKLFKERDKNKEREICQSLEQKKNFLERSMEIVLRMKFEKYKEIFSMLDSDHDGLISKNKIKLSSLDQDLLEAITPLLHELQNSEETMTFKQFCIKIDKLLSLKIFSN